jgi:NADH:ubiquinone oxidoreductase subunit 6 (subunit J)
MIAEDKSLLKCTVKKSLDVTKKLVLYASYIVDAVAATALALYGAFGIWNVVSDAVCKALLVITGFAGSAWGLLLAVPWYVYVGVVAVAAIPVYSFLWCVARELTEEDWKYAENNGTWLYALLFPLIIVSIILESTIGNSECDTAVMTRKIFTFPSAWYHHIVKGDA